MHHDTNAVPEPAQRDLRHALRQGLIKILAWSALSIFLVVSWLHQSNGTAAARQALGDADLLPLGSGCLLLILCLAWPAGWRWRALMPRSQGKPPSSGFFLSSVAAVQILLSLAIPGPVAEVVAADLVCRGSGIRRAVALAASLHARLVGMIVALVHTALLWMLFPLPVFAGFERALLGTSLVIALAVLFLLAVMRWPEALRSMLGSWLARESLASHSLGSHSLHHLLHRVASALGSILEACGRIRFGWPHLEAAAFSSLSYALGATGTLLIAIALGAGGDPIGIFFAYNGVGAAGIVLFLLPAAYVTVDAALCALLVSAGGLSLDAALLVAIVVRLASTAGLVVAALGLGRRLTKAPPAPSTVVLNGGTQR